MRSASAHGVSIQQSQPCPLQSRGDMADTATPDMSLLAFKREVHPTDHHFFPGLVSPVHWSCWVGVVEVVGRVIEVGHAVDLGSFRHEFRLHSIVTLPVKVITWDPKKHFASPVWISEGVLEVLATQMHVRHETQQIGVLGKPIELD